MKTSAYRINRRRGAQSSPAGQLSAATRTTIAALAAALLAALPRPSALANDDTGATLRVEVSSFRNTKGTLNCGLFTKASSFPDGEGTATVRAPIDGTQGVCTFSNLRPGTYAVAVFHDENSNGKLDKNFVGIPTESYGVTNNRTHALSSPKWDESKFAVASGEPVILRVSMRY